ncbi:hypothetical protein BHM03_00001576 [Ensete ventricosum]|nr:hypothetical protein BHM03_00001576 [Ensete ventricosum]
MRRILERLEAFGEFERLEMYGIPVPNYALINREYPYQELDYFVEHEDFVEILGKRFQKPFVEKPIDGKPAFYLASTKVVLNLAKDNFFAIVFSSSPSCLRLGGTYQFANKLVCEPPAIERTLSVCHKEFINVSQVGNRSSEFHPEVRRVRRESSYIYEEFMPTGGTDVKVVYQFSCVLLLLDNVFVIEVPRDIGSLTGLLIQVYTVGPDYAHAEARKSPVVDGVVMRNPDGKEVCSL